MKAHTLISCGQVATMSNVIEAERFETLHKLYRVTAYVIKFLKILRKKSKGGLTTQDLHEAELLWTKDNHLGLEKDKNFTDWKVQFGLIDVKQLKTDHTLRLEMWCFLKIQTNAVVLEVGLCGEAACWQG